MTDETTMVPPHDLELTTAFWRRALRITIEARASGSVSDATVLRLLDHIESLVAEVDRLRADPIEEAVARGVLAARSFGRMNGEPEVPDYPEGQS